MNKIPACSNVRQPYYMCIIFSSNSTPKIKLKIKSYDLIDLFLGKR